MSVEVDPERYEVEATGEIETDDGVLASNGIRVDYWLQYPSNDGRRPNEYTGFMPACAR